MLSHINYFAVLAATLAAFFLGGIWYSKLLFGEIWKREEGMDLEEAGKHNPAVFGAFFALAFIGALALAIALGPNPELGHAICVGFAVGLFYVATSLGINYSFANRGWKMFLIDSGYHLVQYTLYGVILGLWHWPSMQVASGMPM